MSMSRFLPNPTHCIKDILRDANCLCEIDKPSRKSSYIDDCIKEDKKASRSQINILLLGAGEAGKSTIFKQMKVIHGGGYSVPEKRRYKDPIYKNLCSAMISLVRGCLFFIWGICTREQMEDLDLVTEQLQKMFSPDNVSDEKSLLNAIHDNIETLWKDSRIQDVYQRINLLDKMSDRGKYFLNNIDRIGDEKYLPTVDDILRARVPTTGVVEYKFALDGIILNMVDVGGQKGERRKWIHLFENVTSILFLTALSDYDEIEKGSEYENKLKESLDVFRSVISYDFFKNTSLILFLNKIDIFKEKIKRSNLENHFKEYVGPAKDPDEGKLFILRLFLDVFHYTPYYKNGRKQEPSKTFFSHFTCAIDTKGIQVIFAATKDIILRKIMDEVDLA